MKQKRKPLRKIYGFSLNEWAMNGHRDALAIKELIRDWQRLSRHFNNGRFIELGCGTGIFGHLISKIRKDLIPYGIDKDHNKIAFANTKKFGRNFQCCDYFGFTSFERFQTAIIFIEKNIFHLPKIIGLARIWENTAPKDSRLIIFCYDRSYRKTFYGFVTKAFITIGLKSKLSHQDKRFLVISKQKC